MKTDYSKFSSNFKWKETQVSMWLWVQEACLEAIGTGKWFLLLADPWTEMERKYQYLLNQYFYYKKLVLI